MKGLPVRIRLVLAAMKKTKLDIAGTKAAEAYKRWIEAVANFNNILADGRGVSPFTIKWVREVRRVAKKK